MNCWQGGKERKLVIRCCAYEVVQLILKMLDYTKTHSEIALLGIYSRKIKSIMI